VSVHDESGGHDESGNDDILEQGAGRPGSARLGFEAPRWLDFLGPGSSGDGPRWRPSRGAAVLAAVTLLAGLGAGYAVGKGTSGAAPAPRPSATSTAIARSTPAPSLPANPLTELDAVQQLTESCSAQSGSELQLGVEVTNESPAAITLVGVKTKFPMDTGALRLVSSQWAPCGAISDGLSQPTAPLAPGQSGWLSVTVKVGVRCPTPYPVQFTVDYVTGRTHLTESLPGFPDLSQVEYSGCTGSANTSSSTFSAVFLGPVGSPVTVHTLKRR
jgi:hypothetical protein